MPDHATPTRKRRPISTALATVEALTDRREAVKAARHRAVLAATIHEFADTADGDELAHVVNLVLNARTERHTMADALEKYESEYLTPALLAKSTIDYRRRDCRRLRPIVGALPLVGMDWRLQAVRFHESGLFTPAIRTQITNTLARVLTLAHGEWGWLDKPHRIPMKLTQNANVRTRVLSRDEIRRLYEGLRMLETRPGEREDHRWRRLGGATDCVRFIMVTGLRVSEACTLEWSNLDPEGRWVRLTESKTGVRNVVIGRIAFEILARQPRISRWIFAGRKRGHVNRRTALKTVQDAAALVGIEDITAHTCRHTWATMALREGVPSRYVMDALGHKLEETLRRYQHVAADDLRAACERVAAAIAGGSDVR